MSHFQKIGQLLINLLTIEIYLNFIFQAFFSKYGRNKRRSSKDMKLL